MSTLFYFKQKSMENEKEKVIKFTNDQQKALEGLFNFVGEPFSSTKYIVGLTGPAGTGKSTIVKHFIKNCSVPLSAIKCTSTTHKACRVLANALDNIKEVNTIQSTFGLRLDMDLADFDPNDPQFNPQAPPKLDDVALLLIDEASMIPAKLVTYICNKCKDLLIKLVFIGDSYQLAPVNEGTSIAFKRCWKIFELKEIVRQAHDNPIMELLELLRYDIGHHTYRFLEYLNSHVGMMNYNEIGEGFSICNSKSFKEVVDRSFTNEHYRDNIDMNRIIAYTNVCVNTWNNYIRSLIIKNGEKAVITKDDLIMSYETIVNEFNEMILNNSEEYIVNDIADYVDTNYGFKGYAVKLQMVHGGIITKPLFIIDHRDSYTIQRYHHVLTELISAAKNARSYNRVSRWKLYYRFKRDYLIAANIMNSAGKILYSRDLDYGFAITANKAQGSTYETVFTDVRNMVFTKNGKPYAKQDELLRRLYVACSRARKELIIYYG